MTLSANNYFVSIYEDVKYYKARNICDLFWFSLLVLLNGFTSISSSILLIVKYFRRNQDVGLVHNVAFVEKLLMAFSFAISILVFDKNLTFWKFSFIHILFLVSLILFILVLMVINQYSDKVIAWYKKKFPKTIKEEVYNEPGFIDITRAWWKGFKEKHCERIEYLDEEHT